MAYNCKKLFVLPLAALLLLSSALPVVAKEKNKNIKLHILPAGATSTVAVYTPRVVTARGVITSLANTAVPTGDTILGIKLEKITPKKLNNFPGKFPAVSDSLLVHITSDTKLVRKYFGKADLSELAIGDKVDVVGKLQADGSLNATMVRDTSIHITFNNKKGVVTVVDTSAKTFKMKIGNTEFSIYATDATKFVKAGVVKPSLADIKVGDDVAVNGVIRQAANEINADWVHIKIGEKEVLLKQLELKKSALEKRVENVKNNLTKTQAELDAILKQISDLKVSSSTVS